MAPNLRAALLALLLTLTGAAASCGQKGPLELPEERADARSV